nr:phage tail terminator-like protein [uncultured Roseococcus sp.]
MTSPVPWADARARIEAAISGPDAPLAGLPVEWPNEDFTPPPGAWLSIETDGEGMSPIEMGQLGAWTERGNHTIHVMTPVGTGCELGLAIAKALSNLFRNVSAEGGALLYQRQLLLPGGQMDNGNWWITPFVVRWQYTDAPA